MAPIFSKLKAAFTSFSASIGTSIGASIGHRSMGGSTGRDILYRNWMTVLSDANEDISSLSDIRAKSRELYKVNPIATGAVNTILDAVVHTGLTLSSQINAKTLNLESKRAQDYQNQIEGVFNLWSERHADPYGGGNFASLQKEVLRSMLISGDVFVLLPMFSNGPGVQTAIKIIEADFVGSPLGQVLNNRIKDGVIFNEKGVPDAYYFHSQHPGSSGSYESLSENKVMKIKRQGHKRQNVLHILERQRPGQARGLPFLYPIFETLKSERRILQQQAWGHSFFRARTEVFK